MLAFEEMPQELLAAGERYLPKHLLTGNGYLWERPEPFPRGTLAWLGVEAGLHCFELMDEETGELLPFTARAPQALRALLPLAAACAEKPLPPVPLPGEPAPLETLGEGEGELLRELLQELAAGGAWSAWDSPVAMPLEVQEWLAAGAPPAGPSYEQALQALDLLVSTAAHREELAAASALEEWEEQEARQEWWEREAAARQAELARVQAWVDEAEGQAHALAFELGEEEDLLRHRTARAREAHRLAAFFEREYRKLREG